MRFPLDFVPSQSWHERPRSFGAPRNGGSRKHAGCDLYAPVGTPVFAVGDGTVKGFAEFYLGTYALTVDHGEFWVRYGEIGAEIAGNLGVGHRVREGDHIGNVGDLQGLDLSMVHLEMYSGAASGPLTVPSRPPYMRRADLLDPTGYLDAWAAALGGAAAVASLGPGGPADAVRDWQRRLQAQGYAVAVDGDFGPYTDTATRLFQADAGLAPTGRVDAATLLAMAEDEKF